jgi:Ca2+-binding EF-hand superfamily protein
MKQALAIAILASLTLAGCGSTDTRADATAADDAPTVAATMPTTVADPAETQRLRSFEGCDSNGDGFVSAAESGSAAEKIFDAIDSDDDGAITESELTAARTAMDRRGAPSAAELIAQVDQDDDGQLTKAEWIAAESAAFRQGDKDGDGKLSRDEWNENTGRWDAFASQPSPSGSLAPKAG